jgi:hypothetical protein
MEAKRRSELSIGLKGPLTGNPDSFAARVIERLDEGVCANAICAQYGSGESESRCG